MTVFSAGENLLRRRDGETSDGRVTSVELFFDLVFVFAVTQLSHGLLHDLSAEGLLRAVVLLMAVWWAWVYTSWVTNWLDPQRTAVRIMLFVLMLSGLLMSSAIPRAFAEGGVVFAGSYAFMQVGRTLFTLRALRRHSPANYRNFQRILSWLALGAVFWLGGAFLEGDARLILWIIGTAIETLASSAGYYVPGLGRSTTGDWDVEGEHIAERFGLFVIIALGESILVTGAAFAELEWTLVAVAAFASAFVGSVAMWWIYFNIGAERGTHAISGSSDPGRLARLAYTYFHVVIVAGIIGCAVADELVLSHPLGHAEGSAIAAILGGPAIYLIGNILFKRTLARRLPLSHLVGLALLAILAPAAGHLTPLALGTAASAVLVLVAVWETLSLRPRRTPVP